ncbi:superoxide dismutase family protein [Nesterenkonia natronophila]|uniref:Superoxide dismutase family protein n=1 Tax=Nesterenkonia natronophila TaxID=2174932 RepID=A0A3A4F9G5_9MICC|nr:superoxide dismutase family protein [Nesterenkonia natronophila]RJN31837.1 superoxide dismutase family protein [Nesterenkonia natronophila]
MQTSRPRPALIPLTLSAILLLAACGNDDDADSSPEPEPDQETATAADEGTDEGSTHEDSADPSDEPFAEAELADVAGNDVGRISFAEAEEDAGVQVRLEAWGLGPGFRGVSIHERGACEAQSTNELGQIGDFYSAGGSLKGDHVEDMDVIEGEGELEAETPGVADAEGEVAHTDRAGSLPNLLVNEDESGYLEVVTDRLSEDLLLEGDGRAVIIHSAPDHHGNVPERYAPYGPDVVSETTGDTGDRVACGVVE